MTYERLTLVLPQAEMQALRSAARQELRKPRDQARLILLQALGMTDSPKETEERAQVVQTGGAFPVQL